MRRRTLEQIEALDHEDLSDWQIYRMSLVCGGIYEVSAPDDAGRIQRLLIWLANLDSKDRTLLEKVIAATIAISIISVSAAILTSLPEIAGTPEWSRYIPTAVFMSGVLFLTHVSQIAKFKAGGSKLIVEAYKKRMASRVAANRPPTS